MADADSKAANAFTGDLYRTVRDDTLHWVKKLLSAMRDRREKEVCDELAEFRDAGSSAGTSLTQPELDHIFEVRMAHSAGFAHALLEGAIEAFEDRKTGVESLKRLIEFELSELDREAAFAGQATVAGSRAIH